MEKNTPIINGRIITYMILTSDQQRHRIQLVETKRKVDAEREVALETYGNTIKQSKARLRATVISALRAQVPQRQIHLACGYTRAASLAAFLEVYKLTDLLLLSTAVAEDDPSVSTSNYEQLIKPQDVVVTSERNTAFFTDSTGKDWVVPRRDYKPLYYVDKYQLAKLTEEAKAILIADHKMTIMGEEEWDAYNWGKEGSITPERWEEWDARYGNDNDNDND